MVSAEYRHGSFTSPERGCDGAVSSLMRQAWKVKPDAFWTNFPENYHTDWLLERNYVQTPGSSPSTGIQGTLQAVFPLLFVPLQ